ncbi:hypothetical protein [Paenisporosarcina sp. NPDC076898]|uniref:hypothetical protein n=1 Tax=unclassified Paenisporosarcina TaxID=2642018 RepID=UPI003D0471BB
MNNRGHVGIIGVDVGKIDVHVGEIGVHVGEIDVDVVKASFGVLGNTNAFDLTRTYSVFFVQKLCFLDIKKESL